MGGERAAFQIGYDVELAPDGETAMELFLKARHEDRPFDGVLLDLTVRGAMGGKDTVRALLAIDPTVRVVVMLGSMT